MLCYLLHWSNYIAFLCLTELPDDLMDRIDRLSDKLTDLDDLRAKVCMNG